MMLDHVKNDTALGDTYQLHLDATAIVRTLIESSPSIAGQYRLMREFMDMGADEYGGNIEIMVKIMHDYMDKAEGRYD